MKSDDRVTSGPARCAWWFLLIGLFSLVCGAKMWVIHYFGNATPVWDEWDIQAPLIKGYLQGTLSPMRFFAPLNEHRIAFTRLLLLLLFRADKQWDPVLEMVAQAPLHALAIVLLVSRAGRFMSGGGRAALAGFAACLSMAPFGWDNTLQGENAAFYFSVLFGIAVIWLCWRYEALTPRWWLGAGVAFASLFTMASGVFSIVAVTAFLTARLVLERGPERNRRVAGVAILGAIAAFGVAITPKGLRPDLAAGSIGEFLRALTGILSWPCGFHWACFIIQAPLILLVILCLYRRVPSGDGRWFVIIVAAAFWIEAGATAYKRCRGWDASRYCDFWSMLLIVICACLYFAKDCLGSRGRAIYAIVAIWLLVCVCGLLDNVMTVLPAQLMNKRASILEMENKVRNYLRTGDATYLEGKVLYPKVDVLKAMLDSALLRGVLPSNLINPNPPLPIVIQENLKDGFVRNGCPEGMGALGKTVYGSYGKSGAASKADMSLKVAVPKGTREVELQVAGYPGAAEMALTAKEVHVTKYNLAPAMDPGLLWETVTFPLKRNSTSFKLFATDNSQWAWMAFSAPAASNRHALGRWANELAGAFVPMLALGLVFMATGVLMMAGRSVRPCAGGSASRGME